jgi:multidrug efflux pump subunit AcrB
MPPAVRIEILSDKSLTIRASVHEVEFTLVLSIALVVMVIFLFLRNVRATLIPVRSHAPLGDRHLHGDVSPGVQRG